MNQPLPVFASQLTENLELWEKELESACDKDFLLDVIRNGFRKTAEGSIFKEVECQNYRSATHGHRDQVEQIYNELDSGNYILADTKPTIVSSLGAIPKSAGGNHLIRGQEKDQTQVNSMARRLLSQIYISHSGIRWYDENMVVLNNSPYYDEG